MILNCKYVVKLCVWGLGAVLEPAVLVNEINEELLNVSSTDLLLD